jgi:hypothetical protein
MESRYASVVSHYSYIPVFLNIVQYNSAVNWYLGIKIEKKPDGTLEWTQPTLTQSIFKDLKSDGEEIKGRQNKSNIKSVPANTSVPFKDHRENHQFTSKGF